MSCATRGRAARSWSWQPLPDGTSWEVTVEDNGVGFDPTGVVKLGHRGLANIRERAAEIGGTVTIDSRPGAGTRVLVRIPKSVG